MPNKIPVKYPLTSLESLNLLPVAVPEDISDTQFGQPGYKQCL